MIPIKGLALASGLKSDSEFPRLQRQLARFPLLKNIHQTARAVYDFTVLCAQVISGPKPLHRSYPKLLPVMMAPPQDHVWPEVFATLVYCQTTPYRFAF
ncbi:hypothetical protein B5P46_24300 [Rhizobium leguminosarum]|uniref:Uncharacterized protein n=1 Tax=Rhizobium leguminosarum TaxID=384 RepID=A0A4Q1TQ55_RHILE|nr:hypothetical protein B5P46_24300 [Rhizobium leguminosarum]